MSNRLKHPLFKQAPVDRLSRADQSHGAALEGRTYFLPLLCALSTMCLFAPPSIAQWPTYHGSSDLAGVANAEFPVRLAKLWTARVGKAVLSTPVAGDKRIYCATDGGKVLAFNLEGKPLWNVKIVLKKGDSQEEPASIAAPLLFVQGLVLCGTEQGWLYAFDAESGKQRWIYKECSGILGTPNYLKPKGSSKTLAMVIDQPEGKVHAIDIANGKATWVSEGTARCDGSGGATEDRIVFGGCDSTLHVLSPATGKAIDNIEVGEGNEMAGGAVIAGSDVFVGNRSGSLVCIDLGEKNIRWTVNGDGGELFTTAAVKGNKVVIATGEDKILCIDRSSGKKHWISNVDGTASTSPVIAGDKVAYSVDEAIHMISLKDGSHLWSGAVGGELTSPAIVENMLVVGTSDGRLVAFGKKEAH